MKKEITWLLREKYHGRPNKKFKKDLIRFKKGEPLDYVIGFIYFLGCKIDLSREPLIPRPETEYWVERAIKDISSPSTRYTRSGHSAMRASGSKRQNLRILDIFAGSGCIGISVMRRIKNTNLVFAEKDKNLITQIKINCALNRITKNRYKVLKSDIFSNVEGDPSDPRSTPLGAGFDYIFANPPYIPTAKKNRIQKSVLKYEPKVALFGGNDGLLYIRRFLADAKSFLKPAGKIYMEFDSIQKREIEKLIKKYGYSDFKFHKDQYGAWRWVLIKR